MPTIYLSSTYEDLKDYRQVVFEALRKSGYNVVAMEDYVAADRRPVDKCLKDVEGADLYVGLFAFRYGYVPPADHGNPKNLSITELEFRQAESLGKPCLIFVVNDTTAWPRSFDDARTEDDKGERINTLRKYLLTEKLASVFSSPHELSTLVLAAVAKHFVSRQKPEPPGVKETVSPAAVARDIEGHKKQGLMANIFISYTRQSESIARTLANDIEALGYTVWFDQDLSGGQAWWDQILATVRNCDVFVFVLDPEALNSTACKREFGYAADLGKSILPVLVAEGVSTNLLPPALSKIQHVDCRKQDRDAAIRLARALTTIPPPKPLPNPLPASPEVPISYLGSLAEQAETTSTLSYGGQSTLVVDLKRSLRVPETADDARTILKSLRNRRDLFANIAEEVDELLGRTRKASSAPFIVPTLLESRAGKWVRGLGLRTVGIVLPIIAMIVLGTWVVKKDVITKHDILRAQSMFMSYVEPEMLLVEAGTFQQGDIHRVGSSDETPLRDVTMNTFLIGKTEVTFEEYDRFLIATGEKVPGDAGDEGWGRGSRPVINVSWEDATKYAKWRSQKTGKHYRLPTESEWEYAARNKGGEERWAGTSREDELEDFAWYGENSGGKTQEVGKKNVNGLGLHDMSGNVWEWVEDCWHENYTDAPEDGSAWLEASEGNCGKRVIRGGSWDDEPGGLRTSFRYGFTADYRFNGVGFRLAQDAP